VTIDGHKIWLHPDITMAGMENWILNILSRVGSKGYFLAADGAPIRTGSNGSTRLKATALSGKTLTIAAR